MAEAFRASRQPACSTGPRPLDAAPGLHRPQSKRPALLRDAHGSSEQPARSRQPIPPRRLGKALACRRRHVCLHDSTRRPPPWPGVHAGASVGISIAGKGQCRNLGLGKAAEGMWIQKHPISSPLDPEFRIARRGSPLHCHTERKSFAQRSQTTRLVTTATMIPAKDSKPILKPL